MMKRNFIDDAQISNIYPSNKKTKNNSFQHHIILLDETIASEHLVRKIRDIPSSLKYETIVKPALLLKVSYDFDSVKCGTYLIEHIFNHPTIKDEKRLTYRVINTMCWLNLWKNELVKLLARKHGAFVLEYAPKIFQNDREIVLTAVRQDGMALSHLYTLRNDREIVLAAVKQNGMALEYASHTLQNDREIVETAVKENGRAFRYASDTLQNDREIVLKAVEKYGMVLVFASKTLRNDREIVLRAVQQNGKVLEYASEELKNDQGLVEVARSSCFWASVNPKH